MKRFSFFLLIPLFACGLLVRGQTPTTTPELTRPQQERLNRIQAKSADTPDEAMATALEVPPDDRDAILWRWIGDQHAALEAHTEAIAAYEAALEILPTYRDALMNLVAASLASDAPGPALKAVQAAMAEGLRDIRTYEALGRLAEALDDSIVAEAAYREVLLLQTDHGPAREGLARTLLNQERFAEAEKIIRQLIEKHPDRAGLWRLYADLAQSREQHELAVKRLETARRLGVLETADLKRLMELYTFLDRPLEVLRLHRAYASLRADGTHRLRLAEGLLGLGHLEGAKILLDDIPEVSGKADQIRLARIQAQVLMLEEDVPAAIRILENALKEAPLDPALLRLMGEAHMQADNPREAVPHFERLSRQPGHQARGLWLQGVAEARAGDTRQAIELLEAALRIEDLPGLRRTLEQVRRMAQ
ncbi:MAG: tetratricopeptide repeat protein [Verrucomicrobia bacterium]|nr:tetratricopeptide repeat protein [Verrucomicrobiota bacterium]MCH8511701.1 tetratricopeptide repeat protein [Kiritimatiellia bacterium]